jgi:hypothetical protein
MSSFVSSTKLSLRKKSAAKSKRSAYEKTAQQQPPKETYQGPSGSRQSKAYTVDYKRVQKMVNAKKFILQGFSHSDYITFLTGMRSFTSKYLTGDTVKLVEDLIVGAYHLVRSRNKMDTFMALVTFCKLRMKTSFVEAVAVELFEFLEDVEGGGIFKMQGLEEDVGDFRKLLTNWDKVKKSSLGMKYWAVLKHMIRFGWFQSLNIPNTKENHRAADAANPMKLLEGADFIYCLLDATSLTLQRALIWKRTGRWETLLHGEFSYSAWYDKVMELKRLSANMSNLEAIGTNFFKFSSDLDAAVEEGNGIVRYGLENGMESMTAKSLMNELKIIQLNLITRASAREMRAAPFGLLIYGGSGVLKSQFTQILFTAYAEYRGLPKEDKYMYPRDSKQKHWTNFESYMHTILMDDIAYLMPGGIVDPTINEMLSVNNNVPFIPEQAKIEDKGRTPVKVELLLATTNNKNLSATDYFYCPLAIQRRLPFVITLRPKPEYAREESPEVIDPIKVPIVTDEWLNVWIIKLERVVAAGKLPTGQETAKHVPALCDESGNPSEKLSTFTEIGDFMDWFKRAALEYTQIQAKALAAKNVLQTMKICKQCNRPLPGHCTCLQGDVLRRYHYKGGDYTENVYLNEFGAVMQRNMQNADGTIKVCDTDCDGDYRSEIEESADGSRFYHHIIVQDGMKVQDTVVPLDARQNPLFKPDEADMADLLKEVARRSVWYQPTRLSRAITSISARFAAWYLARDSWFAWFVNLLFMIPLLRHVIMRQFVAAIERRFTGKAALAQIGKLAQKSISSPWMMKIVVGLSVCIGAYGTYHMGKKLFGQMAADPELLEAAQEQKREVVVPTIAPATIEEPVAEEAMQESEIVQVPFVQSEPVGDDFFEKSKKEVVWEHIEEEVVAIDVTQKQVNYRTVPWHKVADMFRNQSYRSDIMGVNHEGLPHGIRGNVFQVCGQLYVTCNHLVPYGDKVVKLRQRGEMDGLNTNFQFSLEECNVLRVPEKDLAFFLVKNCTAGKDLRTLVATPTLRGGKYRGQQIGWYRDGRPLQRSMSAVHFVADAECQPLHRSFDYWQGQPNEPCVGGDCGLPLLLNSNGFVALVGIHQGYAEDGNIARSILLTSQDIDAAIVHFNTVPVEMGHIELQAGGVFKQLGALRLKSPLRWIQAKAPMRLFGRIEGFRPVPRSKVVDTCVRQTLEDAGWKCSFVAPKLNDWRPYNHAYNDVLGAEHTLRSSVLQKAVKSFTADIKRLLPASAKKNLKKLSWKAAINGIPGVPHIDKMNFASSMGFPYNHTKRGHLTGLVGDKVFDEEVMACAREMEENAKCGIAAAPVFSGQLKDEPRKQAKVEQGLIRLFMGGPAAWCMYVRRYLLTFVKVMEENPLVFESAIGCTAQSLEWEKFREFLVTHGLEKIIAGDYGKFDKRMIAEMILAAFDVIVEVLRDAGWDEEDLKVIHCIAQDTAFPVAVIDSDLVQFFGSNPSGHPLTVIINSIANALYMRYAYILLNPEEESESFKSNVALLTYGDDNAMGVHDRIPWFNHTAVQQKLAEIGVVYTMADKESESVPYIHIDDVSFLKRKWVWNEEVQAFLCPLEMASIHKMVMVGTMSKSESVEAWIVSKLNSAVREFFFYGREVFEKQRAFMLTVIDKHNLEPEYQLLPFPKWDELVANFRRNSKDVELERFGGMVPPPAWMGKATAPM